MAGDGVAVAVRAGLVAFAAGDALGGPWAGRGPREISKRRLADDAGPTGWATEALLAAAEGAGPSATPLAHLPAALALGLREPVPARRREAALPLGFAAVLVADLAAWALEGRRIEPLADDHADRWYAPIRGIPADDRGVMDGLLWLVHRWDDPADAMRAGVRLGGREPGLLAGLIGAVLTVRRPGAADHIPWLRQVALPDADRLDRAAAALAAGR